MKNNQIGLIIIASLSLAISACNTSHSSDSDTDSFGMPKQLAIETPAKSAPLTASQSQTISQALSQVQVLPSEDLILYNTNEADSDKTKRLKDISDLSKDSKVIYDSEQANCQVSLISSSNETSTTKGISDTDQNGSVSGSQCPLLITKTGHTHTSAPGFDIEHSKGVVDMTISQNTEVTVQDENVKTQSGQASESSKSNMQIRVASFGPNSAKTYANVALNGSTLTTSGETYTYTGTFKMLQLTSDKSMTMTESANMTVKIKGISVGVYMYATQTANQSEPSTRYFVNGNEMTKDQFTAIFGKSWAKLN